VAGDAGLNAARGQDAIAKIQNWREQSDLPFPDFPLEKIAEIKGTIEYPPAGSAIKAKQMKARKAEQP
jgi:MscS family membrane protein